MTFTHKLRTPIRIRLTFETLERRDLPALTSSVAGGVLTIISDAADAMAVTTVAGNVRINGADPGTGPAASTTITSMVLTGGPGANTIDLSGVLAADFTALQSIQAAGNDGADILLGSDLAETLLGGLGNDMVQGGGGSDLLDGGPGNDTIQGGDGNDTISGGTGDDVLAGDADNDTLRGDTSAVPAGAGNDGSESPVDVPSGTQPQDLIEEFRYEPSPLDLEHTGTNFEAFFQGANAPNSFTVDGVEYELENIHFHHRSEHTFNSATFPLEVHFVHRSTSGAIAVLGGLIQVGAPNADFQLMLNNDPGTDERALVAGVTINPSSFLPVDRRVFHYHGSLTTGQFTEGLNWYVFAQPITLSQAQMDAYRSIFVNTNFRATQPLLGREFGHGNDVLNGGDGNDQLFPGGGTNQIVPSAGQDVVHSRPGPVVNPPPSVSPPTSLSARAAARLAFLQTQATQLEQFRLELTKRLTRRLRQAKRLASGAEANRLRRLAQELPPSP